MVPPLSGGTLWQWASAPSQSLSAASSTHSPYSQRTAKPHRFYGLCPPGALVRGVPLPTPTGHQSCSGATFCGGCSNLHRYCSPSSWGRLLCASAATQYKSPGRWSVRGFISIRRAALTPGFDTCIFAVSTRRIQSITGFAACQPQS